MFSTMKLATIAFFSLTTLVSALPGTPAGYGTTTKTTSTTSKTTSKTATTPTTSCSTFVTTEHSTGVTTITSYKDVTTWVPTTYQSDVPKTYTTKSCSEKSGSKVETRPVTHSFTDVSSGYHTSLSTKSVTVTKGSKQHCSCQLSHVLPILTYAYQRPPKKPSLQLQSLSTMFRSGFPQSLLLFRTPPPTLACLPATPPSPSPTTARLAPLSPRPRPATPRSSPAPPRSHLPYAARLSPSPQISRRPRASAPPSAALAVTDGKCLHDPISRASAASAFVACGTLTTTRACNGSRWMRMAHRPSLQRARCLFSWISFRCNTSFCFVLVSLVWANSGH
jgi:hypothetical protein